MLKLDLQFFNDEEETFDLEAFQQEFEAEWNETDHETDVPEEDTTEVEQEEQSEETEQEDEEQGEPEEQTDVDPNDPEEDKRNRAFADLRRQAQENEKYAKFVQQIADQNGLKPEDVMQRFEEQRLAKEAEEQNVPVDVLKRLNELETQNQQLSESRLAERFDSQVNSVRDKYQASDQELQETFKYMADNGLDPRQSNVSFEAAYKMAHMDSIIEKQVQASRQKDLEEKQKRQSSSALPGGNSVSQSDEITDEFIDQQLEKMGIRI